jgi:heme exporter protein A
VPDALVRAEGLERTFAGARVLAGVDLTVEPGELVALLGPNGAGKTTLLRILATLLRPTRGRLLLFGQEAASRSPDVLRRIGYVGHESACYADLTGAENLAFYAELFGVPDPETRVAELLAWTGLDAASRRPVRTYSRGMAQRLALARALVHRPTLVLLDEPFSGLDPEAMERLEERLRALGAGGQAVVFSAHDVDRTAALATRAVVLRRGRVAWSGDATSVGASYRAAVGGRG